MREYQTLEELTQLWGPSGYERQVREYIAQKVMEHCDELFSDGLGNLIAVKKGNGKNKKRIMCAGHMDEIGFCVQAITKEGYLKVRSVGGIGSKLIQNTRIEFESGLQGIITTNETNFEAVAKFDQYYVDIGAKSEEEALKSVRIGEMAVFVGPYQEMLNRNVMTKAFDDRVGCYIMVKTIEEMKIPYHDVYFVFTVQEEFGLIGATVAAERIKPDLGIALDITGCYDTPGCIAGNMKLGKGTAIKAIDASVICDKDVCEHMVELANKHGIKFQIDVLPAGGTDVGAIKKAYYGCKGAALSLATRNGHGPCSICNLDDIDASIDLLKIYVEDESDLELVKVYK